MRIRFSTVSSPQHWTGNVVDMSGTHDFQVVDSEIILEAPIIAVRRDQVVMPGGSVHAREIVEHFGAVVVVALNDRGEVYLLNQWRQAAGQRLYELPAGILDVADEDPLVAAQRELVEEAGLKANSWSLLTDIFTSPGFAEESVRIYLAEDLQEVTRPEPGEEEADMTAAWVPLTQAVEMVMTGQVTNSLCLAGILLANQVATANASRRSVDQPFSIRPTSLAKRRAALLGPDADLKRVPK